MKDILLAEKRDGIPCVIIFPCFNTPKQTLNQVVFIERICLKCVHSTLSTAIYYKELIFFN